ncbi:hypothetical protein RJT34_03559 [Clitoria ternatea]|uniref:NB-ARC domain-containing protein n=1 Tax=Clitoria ternatea TaxID=43366 RepID=A0AAN9KK10_CLITE
MCCSVTCRMPVGVGIGGNFDKAGGATNEYKTTRRERKEQLMDALRVKEEHISIIGVVGPSRAVFDAVETVTRRSKRDNLFQRILTANVTNKPDVARIQSEIGRALGLNFGDGSKTSCWSCCLKSESDNKKEISIAERAQLVRVKMKEHQNVVVVLFDIQDSIDLGQIGIPSGTDHNGCKIILTSTNHKVLLWHMPVIKIINFLSNHFDFGVGAHLPTSAYGTFIKDNKSKEQLMNALRVRDAGTSMIKDAVETAIRRSKRDNLFQIIVTSNVTKRPNLAKIQTEIGRALGLNFDDEMDLISGTSCCMYSGCNQKKRMLIAERAHRLSDKMKELHNVLVVLFDLHENLDLGKIGISVPGCKILLTSTSQEVFFNHIKTDTLIHMNTEV